MPNIKSAEKRVELSKAQNAANKAKRSALRTSIKKFDAAVAAGDKVTILRTDTNKTSTEE